MINTSQTLTKQKSDPAIRKIMRTEKIIKKVKDNGYHPNEFIKYPVDVKQSLTRKSC